MSNPLTPFVIAEMWAAAITADRHLNHWAETHYSRPFAVSIGADMRRPPDEENAPFVTIFPDGCKTGPQRAAYVSNLGIVAGVSDQGWEEGSGIIKMRGLSRLDELCPMLEKAMRMALPGARVQEVETEFEIMEFPLCMALMTITVEESLPVGRR